MSQTFVSPSGDGVALLPVDISAAKEVWDGALCAQTDPDAFFPAKGEPAEPAKRICQACPVRELCLATFGPVLEYGVVGGLTAQERRGMRKAARQGGKEAAA